MIWVGGLLIGFLQASMGGGQGNFNGFLLQRKLPQDIQQGRVQYLDVQGS